MKMHLDPPRTREISVRDSSGRELSRAEVRALTDRRVKWARRAGPRIAVMLEGKLGQPGTLLYFKPEDYDLTIQRVF